MMNSSILLILAIALVFVAAVPTCNYKYSGYVAPVEEVAQMDGVLDWGQCEESQLCAVGREQSPINIVTKHSVTKPELGPLQFESGRMTDVSMTWTGHNQVFSSTSSPENDPSSFVHPELREPYHLIQYHLHTPSEHTLDGEYFDAEIHLVHMNEAKNTLAVIGIFVKQGNASDYSDFFETMIHEEDHEHDHNETKFQDFDPTVFSKEIPSAQYFHYKGSLTTPPCSEGVFWFVMKSPIYASPDQLERLKIYQRHNSRPVQPVYERMVSFYPEESQQTCHSPQCGNSTSHNPTEPAETHHLVLNAYSERQEL